MVLGPQRLVRLCLCLCLSCPQLIPPCLERSLVVRGVMDSEWLADAHAAIDANAGSSLMTEVPEAVLEENVSLSRSPADASPTGSPIQIALLSLGLGQDWSWPEGTSPRLTGTELLPRFRMHVRPALPAG